MNDLNYHIARLQQQAQAALLAAHRPGVDDATQKLALAVWRLSNRLSISTRHPQPDAPNKKKGLGYHPAPLNRSWSVWCGPRGRRW